MGDLPQGNNELLDGKGSGASATMTRGLINVSTSRRVLLVLAAVALSGCMVGPDFREPDAPRATRYTERPLEAETVSSSTAAGGKQRFVPGAENLPEQWWSLYRSEPLDALIRQGLAESPTLAVAQATLRKAQENLNAQTGALLYPGVDANLSASREKVSNASFGAPGTSLFNLYNASVTVSYTLDAFGGSRRELESLQAQVDFQRYQLQGAYLALTGNIVTTAIREAAIRAQIQSTREILAAEDDQVRRVMRQFQLGGASRLELIAQQAQAAQTAATLPPLESLLAAARHQLAALIGQVPSEAAIPAFNLDSLHLPEDIPVSLPSELVRQRPDIQAAEALLHQASADIGVATANLYPQITLNGAFGAQSNQLHSLFAGPSLWSIGAGLLQPLFHGGQLQAERRAAIAAYDAADGVYRDTVLQAFRNVADVLRALEADARTVKAQGEAEALARDTLELTRRQYQLGGTSYVALLVAQRQYDTAKLGLILAQASRYADTAALFQALGGGWWKVDSAASASQSSKVN
ncbi:MAG TPA: efflux transporter outer membrane subunit [Casimicrobiaceae bacterium]|nr:efflux transporter outer membrane subunit [Casimicrobiaceae bacterium]